eukprot:6198670-Pleurochrysis_carterae.AAC.1
MERTRMRHHLPAFCHEMQMLSSVSRCKATSIVRCLLLRGCIVRSDSTSCIPIGTRTLTCCRGLAVQTSQDGTFAARGGGLAKWSSETS